MRLCLYNFEILGFTRRYSMLFFGKGEKKEFTIESEVYLHTSVSSVEYILRINRHIPPRNSKY